MKFKNNLELFANGFLSAEYDDLEYRIASGFLSLAHNEPLTLSENAFFACDGNICASGRDCTRAVHYSYGDTLMVKKDLLKKRIEENPEYADELNFIYEYFKDKDIFEKVLNAQDEYAKNIENFRVGWGGGQQGWNGGHCNINYSLIVTDGTIGLRKKINKYKEINKGKELFYDSLLLCLDALEIYAERYRLLALEQADKTNNEINKKRLLRIADTLLKVPQNPADDFYEACQSFWLFYTFDGVDSPGRFDQYMIDYYRKSDKADREECLDELWKLFHNVRAWNLCISGTDENWNDETNELSYDILKMARKYKFNTPNITMRVSKKTPEELWKSAAETIATGIGMPALYNDECVCPSLERIGIPPSDSHNYCMNGCNQIDIFGKSHMGLEDGEVCLAKCLELVLHEGVDQMTGKKLIPSQGNPETFDTYEKLFNAYKRQVEFVTDKVTEMAYVTQKICGEYAPNPIRSIFVEGCIEKGLDYKNKGPVYGHAQILAEGIADAVDSLAALKHFVYDTKKYTLKEIITAMKNNFEGYEELRRDLLSFDKFGNDCEYVDNIYKEVTEHYNKYLNTIETFRGGIFVGGCSTFNRASVYGKMLGAMPNGRLKGEDVFADSIGAVPGKDKKGPTALIKSVLHADQTLTASGNVLQMKFQKKLFNEEKGINAFINLAKTYFSGGGQQLSINVLSKEELIDAKLHPEKYENLVVRVGGYSDYFNKISPGLQDNIIARTDIEA